MRLTPKTIEDVGNMSMIVQAVAAKHFPRSPPSDTKLARWQQPHIQQGIAHMWKAWRHYRRHTSNTTLEALMARWRTWMQYAKLYRRHRDRCRITKNSSLLTICRWRNKLPNGTIRGNSIEWLDRLHPKRDTAGHSSGMPRARCSQGKKRPPPFSSISPSN